MGMMISIDSVHGFIGRVGLAPVARIGTDCSQLGRDVRFYLY